MHPYPSRLLLFALPAHNVIEYLETIWAALKPGGWCAGLAAAAGPAALRLVPTAPLRRCWWTSQLWIALDANAPPPQKNHQNNRWVNLGPLLYHWAEGAVDGSAVPELSIELSLEDVERIAKQAGGDRRAGGGGGGAGR